MPKRIKEVPPVPEIPPVPEVPLVPEVWDPTHLETAYLEMMKSFYEAVWKIWERIAAVFKKKKD